MQADFIAVKEVSTWNSRELEDRQPKAAEKLDLSLIYTLPSILKGFRLILQHECR